MIKQKKKAPKKNLKDKTSPINQEKDLILATEKLTRVLQVLSQKNTPQYNFFLGIFSGLGTIFGVTIVLTFVLYILTRLSFVPIIGDITTQIVRLVQSNLSN